MGINYAIKMGVGINLLTTDHSADFFLLTKTRQQSAVSRFLPADENQSAVSISFFKPTDFLLSVESAVSIITD